MLLTGKSTPQWSFIQKANDLSDRVTIIFTVCALIAALCYVLTPPMNDFLSLFVFNTEPKYEMPFKSAFFYDIKKSPAYDITYLSIVYWAFLVVGINVSMEIFFLFNKCSNKKIKIKPSSEIFWILERGFWGKTLMLAVKHVKCVFFLAYAQTFLNKYKKNQVIFSVIHKSLFYE